MSDRFKFRVWYKPYNGYVEKRDHLVLLSDGTLCEYDGIEIDSDNYIIEQCTGLKDKNGNLIYESDLVRGAENIIGIVKYGKHPRTNSDSMELGFYIEWQMKYPYRSDICYWTSPENKDCIEIIGNVHEQAEQKKSAFAHNKIEFPEFNDNLLEEFDKQFFEDGQDDDLTETALEQKDVK